MKTIKLTEKERKKLVKNLSSSLGKKEREKFKKINKIIFPDKFKISKGVIQMVNRKCPKCGFEMTYAGYLECSKCGYSEYNEEKKNKNTKQV